MSNDLRVWRDLYAAAGAYYAQRPWQTFTEDDIIGVRSPHSGEILYCCVIGRLGQQAGLVAYTGDAGLRGYEAAASNMFRGPQYTMSLQHGYSLLFNDRADLDEQDLAQIKQLGLKFRQRGSWPNFRSLVPGLFPWFLTPHEAQELTAALNGFMQFFTAYTSDPTVLDSPTGTEFLVYEQVDGRWKTFWHVPDLTPPLPAPLAFDAERAARLRNTLPRVGYWELNDTRTPEPVVKEEGSNERPYFPVNILVVNTDTGALAPPLLAADAEWPPLLADHLLTLIEQAQTIPRTIAISNPVLGALLKDLAATLGTRLRHLQVLATLDEITDEMNDALMDDELLDSFGMDMSDFPGPQLKPGLDDPRIAEFFQSMLRDMQQNPGKVPQFPQLPFGSGMPLELPPPEPPKTRARSPKRGRKG